MNTNAQKLRDKIIEKEFFDDGPIVGNKPYSEDKV